MPEDVLLHFIDDLCGDIDIRGFTGNLQASPPGSEANAEVISNLPQETIGLAE